MNIHDLHKDSLHHAYLLDGASDDFALLESAIEELFDTQLVGNPDVFVERLDALTVDNARAIVSFVGRSAFVAGAPKLVLVYFSTITRESQNILLKTLEEPSDGTHIFILTPNVEMLLPTVLSRCMRVELVGGDDLEVRPPGESADAFIKASVPERLKIIEKIVKDKDKSANKTQMLQILSGVEMYLANNKGVKGWEQGVRAVLQAKEYMHDKGAMGKMLMESVALMI